MAAEARSRHSLQTDLRASMGRDEFEILYQTAFAYYHIGYAGAVTLVFFVIIVAISLVLLGVRQRAKWQ